MVASLWKVDDQATATLMQLFYRNLWRAEAAAADCRLARGPTGVYRHPQWIEHPELLDRRDGNAGPICPGRQRRNPDGSPAHGRQPRPERLPPKYWAAFVLSGSGQ